jgi:hypothetical protein
VRASVSGWDVLSLDATVTATAATLLTARLAALKVPTVAELDMQWVAGYGVSRVLSVRYQAAKRRVTCRLLIVLDKPHAPSFAREVANLTIGVLAVMVNRLAQRGTHVDVSHTATAIARDFKALARRLTSTDEVTAVRRR